MPYEITATRKRPQTFEDLAGQDFVSATLRASIASGRIAHAYLFSGPRGCGKTSTARILAKSLNCEKGPSAEPCGVCDSCISIARGAAMDVIEIDGASNTSVENVRQIKDEVLFPPNSSKYKIYIIDEVHMLSNSAFNALLKTIEEPPPYIVFIFATTELHKVPATIKSRCQQFNFRLIPLDTIRERLVSATVDLGISAEPDALLWIAREATGSLRDAYTLFDQVASFSGGKITADGIRDKLGLVGTERLGALMELCVLGDRPAALGMLDTILAGGVSVEQFTADAVSYVRSLLLIACGIEREALLGAPRSAYPSSITSVLDAPRIERMLSGLFDLYRDMRYSVNPRFELELAVARLCAIRDYIPPAELSRTVVSLKAALSGGKVPGAVAVGVAFRDAMRTAGSEYVSLTEAPIGQSSVQEVSEPHSAGDEVADPGTSGKVEVPLRQVVEEGGKVDVGVIRAGIIQAMSRNRMVLTTCLERSGDWKIEDGHLLVSCANAYDANTIGSDSSIISKKVLEIFGLALRVDARAVELPREVQTPPRDDDDGDDDGDDGPADPVEIVERVFRGRRIPSRQTDGSTRSPANGQ
ncbi:MAG: DNA polymerase III subunit gamma/tau [Spirochaetota bacterium]